MGKTNYYQWINGGCCCDGSRSVSATDNCDCDKILLELSKLNTDDLILQDQIDYVSGAVDTKLDSSAYTPVDLTDYATKEWVEDKGYLTTVQPLKTINGESLIGEGDIVISGGSGSTVDAYTKAESDARFQPIGNYLTEHQPLKTINGYTISGTGNIEITASGGSISVDSALSTASTNPVENKVITEALNDKLDASAYTPTEQVQSDWNQTDTGATDYIKNKPTIPTVPTNVSSFNNDAGYITSGDSVFNNYATTASTANYVTSGNVETQIVNHFWCGTQDEYNSLPSKSNNVLYLIHE